MKDYYLFGNDKSVKISQNLPAVVLIDRTEFDKEKLIKQLEELVTYLKAYAK